MEQLVTPSTSGILIAITRYVSPIYVAKFDKVILGSDVDRPDTICFEDVKEDNFLEWLANNSLFTLGNPFPEIVHSHRGYFFQGNGGSFVVSPDYQEVRPVAPFFRTNQDNHYERRLIIKSQPIGVPIGAIQEKFAAALEERGYGEVEAFQGNSL